MFVSNALARIKKYTYMYNTLMYNLYICIVNNNYSYGSAF